MKEDYPFQVDVHEAFYVIFRLPNCRTWLLIRSQVKIRLAWTPSCCFLREVMVLLKEITLEG